MLLRIFKGTGPGVIFLIVLTLLGLWSGLFLNSQHPVANGSGVSPMPLYQLLQMGIGKSHFLGSLFSFGMVSVISLLIVYLNTSIFFINERTFLPALIFILLSGLIPENQQLNPVLPAAVFLMFALLRIMDGYRKPEVAYNFFDAALLISTGSLFYADLIWFGILVFIGIALLRTGSIIEILVSVIGLITPYLLTFGVYYIFGWDLKALISSINLNLFQRVGEFEFSRLALVAIIVIALITLISLFFLMSRMSMKKIKSRKTFSLLLWTFVISLVAYFVLRSVSIELFWIIAIPVSYFLAHYFIFIKRKILPEIMFGILFLMVVAIQLISALR
jgi:hypothetical protein